ncbi:hypothetical protein [Ancylobacter pratisalsi]|uniref:Uncharacterized protein n=1 Tax=Ancylobacter pratisalsi TaxID=1745854 RepID=A0A6P1YSN4_9HYPH|nr:hypothetical protein [Ancylobacter pratisalsi]QIB35811.1 hypothetical protein G3A50_20415 [Ancylobacter pratisalsi]
MSEHQSDITVPKGRRPPAKKPRISARMRRAVDALISGEAPTQKAAAELAGLSREHFNREMQKPHLRALVIQRTGEMFSTLLPKAFQALVQVLGGDNRAAQLQGALTVLRQFGIVSQDTAAVSVSLNAPGYVIDLSGCGGDGSRARVIDGELVQPADDQRQDGGDGGDE